MRRPKQKARLERRAQVHQSSPWWPRARLERRASRCPGYILSPAHLEAGLSNGNGRAAPPPPGFPPLDTPFLGAPSAARAAGRSPRDVLATRNPQRGKPIPRGHWMLASRAGPLLWGSARGPRAPVRPSGHGPCAWVHRIAAGPPSAPAGGSRKRSGGPTTVSTLARVPPSLGRGAWAPARCCAVPRRMLCRLWCHEGKMRPKFPRKSRVRHLAK